MGYGASHTTSSPGDGLPERIVVPKVRPRRCVEVCNRAVSRRSSVRAISSLSGPSAAGGASEASSMKAKPCAASMAMIRPTMRRGLGAGALAARTGPAVGERRAGVVCWQAHAPANTAASVSERAITVGLFACERRLAGASALAYSFGSGNPRPPGRLPLPRGPPPMPAPAGLPGGRVVAATFRRFCALSICSASKKPCSCRMRVG